MQHLISDNTIMFCVVTGMVMITIFDWFYDIAQCKVNCLPEKRTYCTLCLDLRERFWENSNSINFPAWQSFIRRNIYLFCVLCNICFSLYKILQWLAVIYSSSLGILNWVSILSYLRHGYSFEHIKLAKFFIICFRKDCIDL